VQEFLTGASELCCLSVLANGQIFSVIARPDRGIFRPEDLRGKTIGAMGGSPAEFFLGRFLIYHRAPYQEVTIVDLPPTQMAEALAAGKVDAVMVPDRIFFNVMEVMGEQAAFWPAQGDQDIYWILISRADYLKGHPQVAEKLLRALELRQPLSKTTQTRPCP